MLGRKIFLDLGCHNGQTIEQFFNWYKLIGDPSEFEVYGFDINGSFEGKWEDILNKYPNVTFYQKAIWIKDGDIASYMYKNDESSTVVEGKTGYQYAKQRFVEAIDFSQWLKDNVEKKDKVIVKMDIEGAEFAVLKKVIEDGTDELIDKLLIEFHDSKISVDYRPDRELIENHFKKKLVHWH